MGQMFRCVGPFMFTSNATGEFWDMGSGRGSQGVGSCCSESEVEMWMETKLSLSSRQLAANSRLGFPRADR